MAQERFRCVFFSRNHVFHQQVGKKKPFWYHSWSEAKETVRNAVGQHLHNKQCGMNFIDDPLFLLRLQLSD